MSYSHEAEINKQQKKSWVEGTQFNKLFRDEPGIHEEICTRRINDPEFSKQFNRQVDGNMWHAMQEANDMLIDEADDVIGTLLGDSG